MRIVPWNITEYELPEERLVVVTECAHVARPTITTTEYRLAGLQRSVPTCSNTTAVEPFGAVCGSGSPLADDSVDVGFGE